MDARVRSGTLSGGTDVVLEGPDTVLVSVGRLGPAVMEGRDVAIRPAGVVRE